MTYVPGLCSHSLGRSAQCTSGTASSRSQSASLRAAPSPEAAQGRKEGRKKGVKGLGLFGDRCSVLYCQRWCHTSIHVLNIHTIYTRTHTHTHTHMYVHMYTHIRTHALHTHMSMYTHMSPPAVPGSCCPPTHSASRCTLAEFVIHFLHPLKASAHHNM